MKTLISCIILFGLGLTILVSDRSIANTKVPLVNKSTLVAADTTNTEEFTSHGNEPFWNITVSKSKIVYSSPDAKKQIFLYVAPMKATGRAADFVRVYRLRGKSEGMLIINKVSACSDGMSDKDYPYSATLILGNTVLSGCAEKK